MKTFASHPKSEFWSENNNCLPSNVSLKSGKKFKFNCEKCKHEFDCSPHNIDKGHWCPFCCAQRRCPPNKIRNCIHCFNRSFVSHPKAQFWSNDNLILPEEISLNDVRKFKFNCDICKHQFEAKINNIVQLDNWCPFCKHSRRCSSDIIENCNFCFKNSFASHPKAKYWSSNNSPITAKDVALNSNKMFLFNCIECNVEFKVSPNKINLGTWCSNCKKTTEKLVYNWLIDIYDKTNVIHQAKFNWCKSPKTSRFYPFDFCISHTKTIIEIDGCQHFKQVWNWPNPLEQQDRDLLKQKLAIENGYKIVRLVQKEVWKFPEIWKQRLLFFLQNPIYENGIAFLTDELELYKNYL